MTGENSEQRKKKQSKKNREVKYSLVMLDVVCGQSLGTLGGIGNQVHRFPGIFKR